MLATSEYKSSEGRILFLDIEVTSLGIPKFAGACEQLWLLLDMSVYKVLSGKEGSGVIVPGGL